MIPQHAAGMRQLPRGICAQPSGEDAQADSNRRSAAGAAGPPVEIPGVPGNRKAQRRVRATSGVLGHARRSFDDRTGCTQTSDHLGVLARVKCRVEDLALRRRRCFGDCDHRFDSHGHTGQWATGQHATRPGSGIRTPTPAIGVLRRCHRPFVEAAEEDTCVLSHLLGEGERILQQLHRTDISRGHSLHLCREVRIGPDDVSRSSPRRDGFSRLVVCCARLVVHGHRVSPVPRPRLRR